MSSFGISPSTGIRCGGLAAFVFALAALSATGASAASRSHTSAFADTTRPVTFLREMVVTGSRFPRKFYESPQALSYLSAIQLREQAPAVIGDVLALLPGVDMSKDSPWEQRPVLRGMAGQRSLVLMDGIPMNSARGNGPHPSLVDPTQIERVEVVRGPSSVAYGSDALGGAINIITRGVRPNVGEAGITMKGSVSMSGSLGDNQYGGAFELQPRLGKLGMLVSAGGRHADDFRAPDGKVPHSGFADVQGLTRARYDVSDRMSIEAGWQAYRGAGIGIPGLSTPTYDYKLGPDFQDVFQFRYYDRDLVHLSLDHRYEHSWIASSKVRFYWQGERRNFYDEQDLPAAHYADFGYGPDGTVSMHTASDRFFDLKTYGLQVQATSVQTKDYRFTMGLDAARDVTAGNNITNVYEVRPSGSHLVMPVSVAQAVPRGHFDNYGAYFENEWFVLPQWTLSTGGRWTQYAYKTERSLSIPGYPGYSVDQYFIPTTVNNGAGSGSVGLVYSPTSDLHFSANVANGYRQPNAQDLFFNGYTEVGLVEGNPNLKPETSVTYDLGLRYENAIEAVSGNLFYSNYTNLIDALDITPPGTPPYMPGTYQYTNISKARVMGGEAEGEWALVRQLRAHATVAGSIGDITSRDAILKINKVDADKAPLANVPPLKGTFGLRWDDSDHRVWVEPSMRYSWRTNRLPLAIPRVGQPSTFKKEWLVVDLMAGVKFDNSNRATVGIRNVGDRRYREALASLPSPGRALVLSFSSSF